MSPTCFAEGSTLDSSHANIWHDKTARRMYPNSSSRPRRFYSIASNPGAENRELQSGFDSPAFSDNSRPRLRIPQCDIPTRGKSAAAPTMSATTTSQRSIAHFLHPHALSGRRRNVA
jgi:hypothetical protein